MVNLTWKPIKTFELTEQDVGAPWLMVCEDFASAFTYLKLMAQGEWTPLAGLDECGPDGLTGQSFPDDRLFVIDCPVGTLIGRIGGSSASLKTQTPSAEAGEGKSVAVGSYAVLKLPDKAVGPLFLGFNILIRPIKVKSLKVDISGGS